jgi:hypothetical protein
MDVGTGESFPTGTGPGQGTFASSMKFLEIRAGTHQVFFIWCGGADLKSCLASCLARMKWTGLVPHFVTGNSYPTAHRRLPHPVLYVWFISNLTSCASQVFSHPISDPHLLWSGYLMPAAAYREAPAWGACRARHRVFRPGRSPPPFNCDDPVSSPDFVRSRPRWRRSLWWQWNLWQESDVSEFKMVVKFHEFDWKLQESEITVIFFSTRTGTLVEDLGPL